MKVLQPAEAARAKELKDDGVIRELYLREDARGAVLMLECASVEEARRHIDTLPFVTAGLLEIELIPLREPSPPPNGS